MTPEYVARVMVRDVNAVRRELEAYPDEASVWALPPGVANSGGTLALHIAGNLQHFFGTVLGGAGYKRDRAAEFAKRDVPRSALIVELEAAIVAIGLGMSQVSEARLTEEFPEAIAGHRIVTGEWLIHLVSHLGYHLGQIDYHRRLVTRNGATVGAMAVPELGTARKVAQGIDHLVSVRAFATRAEAELARDLLQAEGIASVLMPNDAGGTRPEIALTTGGAKLLVVPVDVRRAEEALGGLGLPHADGATVQAVRAQARGCFAPGLLGMALFLVAGFVSQVAEWVGDLVAVVGLVLLVLGLVRGTRAA